jgi:hypothetical protein
MKNGLHSVQQMHLDRQRLRQGQHLHTLADDDTNAKKKENLGDTNVGHLKEDQEVAVQAGTALRRYLDSSNKKTLEHLWSTNKLYIPLETSSSQ